MQDWFNFLKSIYVFQCFNKLKKKKQITISIDAEKNDKIQHLFMTKKQVSAN